MCKSGDRDSDHVLEFAVTRTPQRTIQSLFLFNFHTHRNQERLASVEGKPDVSLAFIVEGIEIEIEMRRSNRTPTHQQ